MSRSNWQGQALKDSVKMRIKTCLVSERDVSRLSAVGKHANKKEVLALQHELQGYLDAIQAEKDSLEEALRKEIEDESKVPSPRADEASEAAQEADLADAVAKLEADAEAAERGLLAENQKHVELDARLNELKAAEQEQRRSPAKRTRADVDGAANIQTSLNACKVCVSDPAATQSKDPSSGLSFAFCPWQAELADLDAELARVQADVESSDGAAGSESDSQRAAAEERVAPSRSAAPAGGGKRKRESSGGGGGGSDAVAAAAAAAASPKAREPPPGVGLETLGTEVFLLRAAVEQATAASSAERLAAEAEAKMVQADDLRGAAEATAAEGRAGAAQAQLQLLSLMRLAAGSVAGAPLGLGTAMAKVVQNLLGGVAASPVAGGGGGAAVVAWDTGIDAAVAASAAEQLLAWDALEKTPSGAWALNGAPVG